MRKSDCCAAPARASALEVIRGRELSPGLPRDGRKYYPLYYRGSNKIFPMELLAQKRLLRRTSTRERVEVLRGRELSPGLPRDGRKY